ncbi:MAG: hypothetical protein WBI07_02195 [Mobilitalea sp.]
MELFRLFGTVLIDDKDAINALKSVDKQGKTTKTNLSGIATKGAAIGTAIIAGTGVAIGGLLSMAKSTSETAGTWLELSQRTDIGVESLQRWGYAASQSGADVGKLEVGMKKLSTSIIDAQGGSEKAVAAYDALGISMSDLSSMTPEQTFDAVMAKLADMPESAEKNVIGNQLLGKSYTELKPLLAEGSAGMEALKNKADELGIVMSEDSVVAAEGYGDSMDNVTASFDGIKNNLMSGLMPKLTELADWFVAKMPAIQDFVTNGLDKVSAGITWISDNANILLPILGLLGAAFVAMKVVGVISGLITAWSTVTKIASGIQLAFNAVMNANPIALVILAITALIAIGILLYKNWDTIKAGASALWEKVETVFEGIKTAISEKLSAVWETVKSIFGKIFDVITSPFQKGMEIIKGVIDKIKGFLNFNWEFPKLKMPHFSVSGSMNPLKWIDEGLPKIGVEWYAKGGIFDKPTLFNTPYGLKGVGEAGAEVVAPLSDLKSMLGLDNQNKEIKFEVSLNIENFNNNSDADIESIADQLAFLTKKKLEGSGVFA